MQNFSHIVQEEHF